MCMPIFIPYVYEILRLPSTRVLHVYQPNTAVLVTGTPLQNTIRNLKPKT